MHKILAYTKGYRLTSILSALLVIAEVVMEIIIPSTMGNIINAAQNSSGVDFAYIKTQSILLVVYAFISLIFGVSSGWCAAYASTGFAKNLRMAVFEKLQFFSFKNIDHFSQGGLVTRVTGDIFYIQVSYQMLIRVAIRLPIMLILALISALRISPSIGKIYLFVIPILGIALAFISYLVMPIYRKAFDQIDELNNTTQENLHAVRVVKSFVRGEHEKQKFQKVVNPLYKLLLRAEKTVAFTNPVMRFTIYGCILLVSFFGSKLIVNGSMQTGDLVAMFTYNMQMFFSMMIFAMIITMIIMSRACFVRINEVFNEELDITSPVNGIKEIYNGEIVFENVDFSYNADKDKLALKNINLKIASGEVLGVVGPTGCGKTTLVNLIARLYDATSGNIKVSGNDVKDYDLKVLRDNVSVVLQKNNLFSGTIRSTLQWGCEEASDDEIWNALECAQIKDYVSSLPSLLDTRVEQGGKNFSGGQRQRLCIARSLLKNPKILILDDSSSALDTRTDKALRDALKTTRKDLTKIIIAQKILSVMDCDRIVVMKRGEIEDIGTHEELLKRNEFYKMLFLSQQNSGNT